jgi:nucleotide-binding universal stress UspA family protein
MSYKDLLVVLDRAADAGERIAVAAMLAERSGAHLVGLYPVPDPAFPARAGYLDLALIESAYQEFRLRATADADAMRETFENAARARGLSFEWRAAGENWDGDPALHARYADLTVLGQIDPDNAEMAAFRPRPERVTLASGRPILVVPYAGHFATLGRRVVIGWDASREATRAVADALPLLTAAEQVSVLAVDPREGPAGHGETPGADISLHLARHGVKAAIERTVSAGVPIGDVLLSRAADLGADLLVMGAYGHSRARELLLGGATRTVLDSMTVPVLMSH